MREWKKPEVKVFDVKMDENIAASGDRILNIRHNKAGVLAGEWERYDYRVSGNMIVDTNHTYRQTSTTNSYYYTMASAREVSSCLA